jgi:anti-anti-sigma regulatory factor
VERAALQEEVIAVQRATLAELSTPVIPITDTTVVLPMIGTMSEERAEQMLEAALAAVAAHRTRVVIIDVTGLKLVDDRVATTLVRTAAALRLLGARAVITGIRGELAQALIALEVDLGDVIIRGTVQGGIAYALGRPARGGGEPLSAPRGAAR